MRRRWQRIAWAQVLVLACLLWQADFSIADCGATARRAARIRLSHLAFSSSSLPDSISDADAVQLAARILTRPVAEITGPVPTCDLRGDAIRPMFRRGFLPARRFVHSGTHPPSGDIAPA